MKHVIWKEGASGPGIDRARAFLRGYFGELLAMAARKGDRITLPPGGPYDPNLRTWVRQFQTIFNASNKHAARESRRKLGRLPDNGDIDWRTRVVMDIPDALADDPDILLPEGVEATPSPLTGIERKAARPGEVFIGSAYRVANVNKLLVRLGLEKQEEGASSIMRIAPLDEGRFIVPEGHPLYDEASGKSECAALVQSLGVPNTNQWRRGPRVQDVEILAPGTVIATLGSGVYLSDYSGKSHVGIFLAKRAGGIVMLDQFAGGNGKLAIRFKPFGAKHKISPVSALRYIDQNYSYRVEVLDALGNKSYVQDHTLATVRTRVSLTQDGSEYYVLLGDGRVARKDLNAPKLRTRAEDREAVKALVDELWGGIKPGDPKAAGEAMHDALEDAEP
jgi:hypothetical protein